MIENAKFKICEVPVGVIKSQQSELFGGIFKFVVWYTLMVFINEY
jgi:hypothetical protein